MIYLEQAKKRLAGKNLLDGAFSDERIKANDKRIINGTSDVNQIVPIKYEWAWQKYLDACANNWMPNEISMQRDIAQWKSDTELTTDEKLIIETSLGFFSTADTLVANNLVLAIYERITAPECRQYLLRQMFEEGMHAHAYQYCIESLGMDEGMVFNQYREVPEMAAKMSWANQATKALQDKNSSDQDFLCNLIAYYVVVEGVFFYTGFPTVLSLGRRNKMSGIAEQFQYILRDESMHLNFGIDCINMIKIENPDLWTEDLQQRVFDLIMEGLSLELDFASLMLPNGVIGMNIDMISDYQKYIVNRRLQQVGLNTVPEWDCIINPLPWMSEMMDLRKEKNFFETKVTDYQAGGLDWDD